MHPYLVAVRSGLNDLLAIKNLKEEAKSQVIPLISLRGTSFRDFDKFIEDWGDRPLLLDISRQKKDLAPPRQQEGKPQKINILLEHDYNNPEKAYERKRDFFNAQTEKNSKIIPVIGWREKEPIRDITQCAIALSEEGNRTIAVRVSVKGGQPTEHSARALESILAAVPSPEKCLIIYDFHHICEPPLADEDSWIYRSLERGKELGILLSYLLSTSFPKERPENGQTMVSTCLDWQWQSNVRNEFDSVGYGDYGTSDPVGDLEFVPGMPTIPYAGYFCEQRLQWWTTKTGKDKEFNRYIEIARSITKLGSFHGPELCWANENYCRIAALPDNANSGYGMNGQWLGYRINQHVSAILKLFPLGDELEEDLSDL